MHQSLAMTPRDRAILEYLKSRNGIIAISIFLTVCGTIFILATGRYELTFFVVAGLLPWVEHWYRTRKK